MEGGFELEDDVFFADLSKQISLLIMDDDDDDSLVSCPSVNLQAISEAIDYPGRQASFVKYDHHQQIMTSKRESKGTGVFIPRSSTNPRRKNVKQGRFTAASPNNKFQRPSSHDHNYNQYLRGGFPHMPNYNNNINPSYDSFNLRRL